MTDGVLYMYKPCDAASCIGCFIADNMPSTESSASTTSHRHSSSVAGQMSSTGSSRSVTSGSLNDVTTHNWAGTGEMSDITSRTLLSAILTRNIYFKTIIYNLLKSHRSIASVIHCCCFCNILT